MTDLPAVFGVIPTRYASSRFEGKPLALILGKPMLWHVYQRARGCPEIHNLTLATDDHRIFDSAEGFGIPVMMTSKQHRCGTERVLEAAEKMAVPDDAVVINIQGDEPALEPEMLSQLVKPFSRPDIQVTTLARAIDLEDARNPDQVKVVFDKHHRALYFSRSLIPFPRDGQNDGFFGHIGLYAFRMEALRAFVAMDSEPLERREKLEQLRLLENGLSIQVVETACRSYGVDRPDDIETVERIITGEIGRDGST